MRLTASPSPVPVANRVRHPGSKGISKMAMTSTTVVGVFDDYATAQRVVQDLIDSGFRRDDVQITNNSSLTSDAARGNAGLSGDAIRHDNSGGGISGFFHRMFGSDEDD